jgi:hypothetical protein
MLVSPGCPLNHVIARHQARSARPERAWCSVRRVLSDDVMHRATALAKHKVAGSTPVTRSSSSGDLAVRCLALRLLRCRFGAGSSPAWGVQRPHRGVQVRRGEVRVAERHREGLVSHQLLDRAQVCQRRPRASRAS